MARQALSDKTKTFNIKMPQVEYDILRSISHQQSKQQDRYISVGELIREAYRAIYYEEIDEA